MDFFTWLQSWLIDNWRQEVTAVHDAPGAFFILMVAIAIGWRLIFYRTVSHALNFVAKIAA